MNKQRYYKDIEGTRVWYNGVIKTSGKQIFTWKEELILADGWIKYIPPTPPPPYEPTREEKIHDDIRAKYTENDEFMITRQYLANPDNVAFKTAFEEYNDFVEEILAKYPEENN